MPLDRTVRLQCPVAVASGKRLSGTEPHGLAPGIDAVWRSVAEAQPGRLRMGNRL